MSYNNIPKNPSNTAIWANLGPADYYVLSTDTKPNPGSALAGVCLEETDTGSRFRWTGTKWINVALKGAINIHDADVHNTPVNEYIHRHTTTTTTLSANADIGDTQLSVVSSVGFSAGDAIHLGPDTVYTFMHHPIVTAVAAGLLTIDRPLDIAFTSGDDVIQAILDLSSTVGTLASPISYKYWPITGVVEHVTRIIISMVHGSAADDSKFGDLTALTNGVVFRASVGGVIGTFTNWKTNSDIIQDMYDVVYTDKAGGGAFGTRAKGSFLEISVAVRLDSATDDYLEILVQDNLTALDSFKIKVQGHIEGY
jgi:hypothetical protein